MAVGNVDFPEIFKVSGIKLGSSNAGIKQTERNDLLIIEMIDGTTCAGVFTQNAFCAAPVHIAKEHLPKMPRWLLINAGNANAGTGEQGMQDANECCALLASLTDGDCSQVLPFSTGVIGENLPVDKIEKALPAAINDLREEHWNQAAHAIMTTDTFAKAASVVIEIEGQSITLSGISKGAGMVQPNMATVLAFVATDAKISQSLLQQCLSEAAEQSFNRITVDGDTSTNDACILMASGQSLAAEILPDSQNYAIFSKAVKAICKRLAELIIRDGEGATKLMRIYVEQGKNDKEALLVGKTVAHSPLVKTAFFASDPNWGRILAAVGRSGLDDLDLAKIEIYLNDVCIVKQGCRADTYTEERGQQVMDKEEITIRIILGRGNATEEVLTCDLSYDYVRINAEYRT
ncbi:MAG: bifunctional glutamate N-acetyltransferase/amino-acid acetyltransferase ArgJ [Methylococcales symbiont of Iophon sp. n. MRB-2018]|nr:MAG: bifunctional glutamate N-acetyltransferase/amino-acid acetyltransferase ArgJ [Methylococcales symbiont of Iophon sp. n. MRB-2018]KAF3979968.1 MAG: bifunctional glutamate N-acetyltransferase/amino-acid acetyltransferase ArgJ [Methylococcales symbiont of Iophon sp. n. MRB-2018]